MSSTKDTYINIGVTCVDTIESTFHEKINTAQMHNNKIIQLNQRVEHLCKKIGRKKVNLSSKNAVDKLLHLNNDLYRAIFEEEPPTIEGHSLHVAITLLERICVLLLENNCMKMLTIKPTLTHLQSTHSPNS